MHSYLQGSIFFSIVFLFVRLWWIKVIPIYLLAAALFQKEIPANLSSALTHKNAILIGLFLSSFGDIFLDWVDNDKENEYFFIPGLIAFLFAHLAYIYGMVSFPIQSNTILVFPFIVLYYYFIMKKLIPNAEEDLRIPILVYGLAICSMAFMAINRFFTSTISKKSSLIGLIGSIFFVISDSILAFNKFYSPIPMAKVYVMITYYTAQILIASSVLVVTYKRKEDH